MSKGLELEPDIDLCEKRAVVMALGTMIHVGTPIIRAIEGTKENFAQTQRMKDALDSLITGIRAGHTLCGSISREQFPELDDGLFLPLVDAGEQTGELDLVLLKIGGIYAKELESRTHTWVGGSGALIRVSQLLELYTDAGLPVLRSLHLMKSTTADAKYSQMSKALGVVIEYVESGHTLSESMNRLPKFFPKPFVEMIRIAEEQGAIDKVLGKLNLH